MDEKENDDDGCKRKRGKLQGYGTEEGGEC